MDLSIPQHLSFNDMPSSNAGMTVTTATVINQPFHQNNLFDDLENNGNNKRVPVEALASSNALKKKRRISLNGAPSTNDIDPRNSLAIALNFSDALDLNDKENHQMKIFQSVSVSSPRSMKPSKIAFPSFNKPLVSREERSRSVEAYSSDGFDFINSRNDDFTLRRISQPSSPMTNRNKLDASINSETATAAPIARTPSQKISPPNRFLFSDPNEINSHMQDQSSHKQQSQFIQPPKSNVNPFITTSMFSKVTEQTPLNNNYSKASFTPDIRSPIAAPRKSLQMQSINQNRDSLSPERNPVIARMSAKKMLPPPAAIHYSSTPFIQDTSMEREHEQTSAIGNSSFHSRLAFDISDDDNNKGYGNYDSFKSSPTNRNQKIDATEPVSPSQRWLSNELQKKLTLDQSDEKPRNFRQLYLNESDDNADMMKTDDIRCNLEKEFQRECGGSVCETAEIISKTSLSSTNSSSTTPSKDRTRLTTPTSNVASIDRQSLTHHRRPSDANSPLPSPPQKQLQLKRVPSEIVADRRAELHARAIEHAHQPEISRLYNEFEDLGILGKGSFGTVRKVRNRVDGCLYAVKNTNRQFRGVKDKERILKEVYVLAAICSHVDNPHIVRYFNAWIEDQRLFIQTELCETSLDRYVKSLYHVSASSAQLELTAIDVLRQILDGLKHLHSLRLVHLDLKPENIFVKNGIFKIGDLGHAAIARISSDDGDAVGEESKQKKFRERAASLLSITSMDADSPCRKAIMKKQEDIWLTSPKGIQKGFSQDEHTSAASSCSSAISEIEDGDSRYMPKELLNENFGNLPKADIFSLGASIYEVFLHRSLPPNGSEWEAIRDGKLDEDALSHVSKGMRELIRLMMHPDPVRRPSAEVLLKTGGPDKILLSEEDAEHARNIAERNNLRLEVERLRSSNNITNNSINPLLRHNNEYANMGNSLLRRANSM